MLIAYFIQKSACTLDSTDSVCQQLQSLIPKIDLNRQSQFWDGMTTQTLPTTRYAPPTS